MLTGKNVVVFGGSGSLGKLLVRRLLSGEVGMPAKVLVVSRDEAKHHDMRLEFERFLSATARTGGQSPARLQFHIGDIRDYHAVRTALRDADFVVNAAALKQVPTCEYFPFEAVKTNVLGTQNIILAIQEGRLNVECVVGISTDKACKPVNVMGMTKAVQERLLVRANLDCPGSRFVSVRYGNVLASRGSVIPVFQDQIARGGPVTLTTADMTRFLLSLDKAVDTIFAALLQARPGEIFVPQLPAARVIDIASVMIGDRPIDMVFTGIRPGEKESEVLIADEEAERTVVRGEYYVILPLLTELCTQPIAAVSFDRGEYSSALRVMSKSELRDLLRANALLVDDTAGAPASRT